MPSERLVQQELVLSCQQRNSSLYLISIITWRQQGFFNILSFLIKSSHNGCPVEAEHYFCKTISALTAEFNGFTFPKKAVCTTGSAVSADAVGILLSVDINSSSLHSSQLKASLWIKEQLIKKGNSRQQSY